MRIHTSHITLENDTLQTRKVTIKKIKKVFGFLVMKKKGYCTHRYICLDIKNLINICKSFDGKKHI